MIWVKNRRITVLVYLHSNPDSFLDQPSHRFFQAIIRGRLVNFRHNIVTINRLVFEKGIGKMSKD